ncbi:MAG: transposase, partial [Candidatus Competibacter phosphatis]
SRAQQAWLKFSPIGVLRPNTVCWKAFERVGLSAHRLGALSWMFRHSKVAWDGLLRASAFLVLRQQAHRAG